MRTRIVRKARWSQDRGGEKKKRKKREDRDDELLDLLKEQSAACAAISEGGGTSGTKNDTGENRRALFSAGETKYKNKIIYIVLN